MHVFLLAKNTEQKNHSLLSGRLKEKLKQLEFKRYQYILIADKMPRERAELAVIGILPWAAVFDLDPLSERQGLLHATLTAVPESMKVWVRGNPQFMHLNDFQDEATSSELLGSISRRKGGLGTRWIFCNGRNGVIPSCETYPDWIDQYGKKAVTAIAAAITNCEKPAVVVFLTSGSDVPILSYFITNVYCNKAAARNVVVVSSDYSIAEKLTATGFSDLKNKIVAGMSWTHVSQNIKELMEGRSVYSAICAKLITSSSGALTEIPDDELSTWNEIEVVASNECENEDLGCSPKNISLDFYKGEQPSWMNFRYDHEIERDLKPQMVEVIRDSLSGNFGEDGNIRILLRHHPGTGGTTLCKRLLWEFRKEFRCAQILSLTNAEEVARQVHRFYVFNEADTSWHSLPPVFLLIDSVDDHHIRSLQYAMNNRGVKAVILVCTSSSSVQEESDSDSENPREFHLPPKLSSNEIDQVREKIVATCVEDRESQERIMQDVERNKELIYLGLQLFGQQEYRLSLVQTYVKKRLDAVPKADVYCLKFCSLTYTYGHKSLPKQCFADLVTSLSPGFYFEDREMKDYTKDLLVECDDNFAHYHYVGYRPAHHFVGEIITKEFDLVETLKEVFDLLLGRRLYSNQILRDLMVRLFTKRRLNYEDDEDVFSADAERKFDDYSRYSPLVTTLLLEQDVEKIVFFFLTLAQKSRGTFSEGYVWQHLCRLFTHEIESREVDQSVAKELLSQCADRSTLDFRQKTNNLTGYDAAHLAIDNAKQGGKKSQLSFFYHTKGLVYKRQMALLKSERTRNSIEELQKIVDLTQKACQAFKLSRTCAIQLINWHPFIDEIEVRYDLLQVFKDSTFLESVVSTGKFRQFLEGKQRVHELESLGEARLQFVSNLEKETQLLFHTMEERQEFSKGWNRDREWTWQWAQRKGSELNGKFCELAELEVNWNIEDNTAFSSYHPLQYVDAILRETNEGAFTAWKNLREELIQAIVNHLAPICLSKKKDSPNLPENRTMAIFVRACFELAGKLSTTKHDVTFDALATTVDLWCRQRQGCIWAFFYQYVLCFPSPQGIWRTDVKKCQHAVRTCQELGRQIVYTRAKKSRVKFFLGKGSGMSCLLSVRDLNKGYTEDYTKDEFWKEKGTQAKLTRLTGVKIKPGIISYRNIDVIFDDKLYPLDSRDNLMFYLGFGSHGPYAFHPLKAKTGAQVGEDSTCAAVEVAKYEAPAMKASFPNDSNSDVQTVAEVDTFSNSMPIIAQRSFQRRGHDFRRGGEDGGRYYRDGRGHDQGRYRYYRQPANRGGEDQSRYYRQPASRGGEDQARYYRQPASRQARYYRPPASRGGEDQARYYRQPASRGGEDQARYYRQPVSRSGEDQGRYYPWDGGNEDQGRSANSGTLSREENERRSEWPPLARKQ